MSEESGGSGKAGCSFGLGSLIACALSYAKWHSIGWAILHTLLGWLYVLYYLFRYVLFG